MAEIPEQAIDVSEAGDKGVLKLIIKNGTGTDKPCVGDKVSVHYTGTIFGGKNHGKKFDSSRDRNSPFEFTLGQGQVIKGWDQSVATMTRGELVEVFLAPEYGYGATGAGSDIPPNATLKFEIELLSWAGEDVSEAQDGSVMKTTLRRGLGMHSKPALGAHVTVNLVGKLTDSETEVDRRDNLEFDVGEADEVDVCTGVEQAVKKMNEGERARIWLQSSAAYGAQGNSSMGIPADAALVYEVELVKMEAMKESWELSAAERLANAELLKAKGTKLVTRSSWRRAASFYERAEAYLKDEEGGVGDFTAEETEAKLKTQLALHLNLALCQLKLKEFGKAAACCDQALEVDSKSDKALFRRGQARAALGDLEEARADYRAALAAAPNNKAAHAELLKVQQLLKAQQAAEKKTFFGMFDKFAAKDAQKQVQPTPSETDSAAAGDEETTETSAPQV